MAYKTIGTQEKNTTLHSELNRLQYQELYAETYLKQHPEHLPTINRLGMIKENISEIMKELEKGKEVK